jgi:hypothetical protein
VNAVLIVAFGLLQIADGVVTFLGLKDGCVEEVNPVLNYCIDLIGLGSSITVLKAAGIVFIIFMFLDRHSMKNPWITRVLGTAVAFYSWVVGNNVILVAST